jgi:hypothetical protein
VLGLFGTHLMSNAALPLQRCHVVLTPKLCCKHCVGSIEYAIAEDRMTDDGGLWVPLEEDVTLKRCGHLHVLLPA